MAQKCRSALSNSLGKISELRCRATRIFFYIRVIYRAEMRERDSVGCKFFPPANWNSGRVFALPTAALTIQQRSQNDTRPASFSRQYNISTQVEGISLLLSDPVGSCWQPIIAPRRRLANLQRLHYMATYVKVLKLGEDKKEIGKINWMAKKKGLVCWVDRFQLQNTLSCRRQRYPICGDRYANLFSTKAKKVPYMTVVGLFFFASRWAFVAVG